MLEHCKHFAKPDTFVACVTIAKTVAVEACAIACIHSEFALLGWVLHALNRIRWFVIFHDMAHYSFFPSVTYNQYVGELLGAYMMFPFQAWRDGHNHHHQHFGILGGEDVSQTILFTKQQYISYPFLQRFGIRLVREPVVFFFLTIPFVWTFGTLIQYLRTYPWTHTIVRTKCLSLLFYCMFASWQMWVAYYCTIVLGGILFHLQHSVNVPYRKREDVWKRDAASVLGSTFLQVPSWLSFFTLGIEYHHIHHLHVMVPSYAIGDCHTSYEGGWTGVVEVSPLLALESLSNVMLDEETDRLVGFSHV
jgi:omega-6 fatty acid desaturase (delta-12 desaturase)